MRAVCREPYLIGREQNSLFDDFQRVDKITAPPLRWPKSASAKNKSPTRAAKRRGILAVEMEAAALNTLAQANKVRVLCLALVTNTMGQTEQDFEKGEAEQPMRSPFCAL